MAFSTRLVKAGAFPLFSAGGEPADKPQTLPAPQQGRVGVGQMGLWLVALPAAIVLAPFLALAVAFTDTGLLKKGKPSSKR